MAEEGGSHLPPNGMRCTPVRCTLVRCTPMRCTPMRCTPVRYTPMRCTPVRYTMISKGGCDVPPHALVRHTRIVYPSDKLSNCVARYIPTEGLCHIAREWWRENLCSSLDNMKRAMVARSKAVPK